MPALRKVIVFPKLMTLRVVDPRAHLADSWSFVWEMLTSEQWSPDQISAALKELGRPAISHETIYTRIYADKQQGGTLHTLTYDNGKEFTKHEMIDAILDSTGYFAHPYSSWERGLNENTNGLIRQYFPKKINFDDITDEAIALVQGQTQPQTQSRQLKQ